MEFNFIQQYFTLLLIYKIQGRNSLFKVIDNKRNTRNNNVNLICPSFRTKLFKNSVISFSPKIFNELPYNKKCLLQTVNCNIYKQEIRTYLLCQQNVSLANN